MAFDFTAADSKSMLDTPFFKTAPPDVKEGILERAGIPKKEWSKYGVDAQKQNYRSKLKENIAKNEERLNAETNPGIKEKLRQQIYEEKKKLNIPDEPEPKTEAKSSAYRMNTSSRSTRTTPTIIDTAPNQEGAYEAVPEPEPEEESEQEHKQQSQQEHQSASTPRKRSRKQEPQQERRQRKQPRQRPASYYNAESAKERTKQIQMNNRSNEKIAAQQIRQRQREFNYRKRMNRQRQLSNTARNALISSRMQKQAQARTDRQRDIQVIDGQALKHPPIIDRNAYAQRREIQDTWITGIGAAGTAVGAAYLNSLGADLAFVGVGIVGSAFTDNQQFHDLSEGILLGGIGMAGLTILKHVFSVGGGTSGNSGK